MIFYPLGQENKKYVIFPSQQLPQQLWDYSALVYSPMFIICMGNFLTAFLQLFSRLRLSPEMILPNYKSEHVLVCLEPPVTLLVHRIKLQLLNMIGDTKWVALQLTFLFSVLTDILSAPKLFNYSADILQFWKASRIQCSWSFYVPGILPLDSH